MSCKKAISNGSWLLAEKTSKTKLLMEKLENNFLKDIQKLKHSKNYSDMDVFIEKENMRLHHKCVLLCLAPTLYEFLFLSENVFSKIFDFPENVPQIERNSLRIVYKQNEQDVICTSHEVDITSILNSAVHSDVAFKINNDILHCHRCILSVRCEYFEIMFSGHWREKDQNVIPINGMSMSTLCTVIEFLYNPKIKLSEDMNLLEIASAADMYMLLGLKELVQFYLELHYCHFFHQPCNICIKQISHAIFISEQYGYTDLSVKCYNWLAKHYAVVFANRDFNSCRQDYKELIIDKIKLSVSSVNVLQHLKFCSKLIKTLPSTNWANKTQDLISELNSFCLKFVCDNFEKISKHPSFILVCYDKKNFIWMDMAQDFIVTAIKTYISIENCVNVHFGLVQINNILNVLKRNNECEGEEHCNSFLSKLDDVFKHFITKNFHGICRASYWKTLSKETQKLFKENSGFLVS
uniref:BTB/POZ domain-containing protein 8 n=1 Tax=Hydra vulgaris TaxID=6087 RepID=T2MBQ9_HYDVU